MKITNEQLTAELTARGFHATPTIKDVVIMSRPGGHENVVHCKSISTIDRLIEQYEDRARSMSEPTRFDRHEHMDDRTRTEVMSCIKGICLADIDTEFENYLYGAFDGYDYSNRVLGSLELRDITKQDKQLGDLIACVFETISKYPRS